MMMKAVSNLSKKAKLFTLIVAMLATSLISNAQGHTLTNEIYGLGYGFETSRILKNRMFIEGNYTVGRRTFEVGLSPGSYNNEGQGFMFKHKIFLNKKKKGNMVFDLNEHNFRMFAMYKFIMFTSSTESLRKSFHITEERSFIKNTLSAPTINTIEHYLGIGTETKIFKNVFWEVAGMAGVNFIKNNSELVIIEDKLFPQANLDISWNVSMGLNYRF